MVSHAVKRNIGAEFERVKRLVVKLLDLCLDVLDPQAADPRNRAGKVAVDQCLR